MKMRKFFVTQQCGGFTLRRTRLCRNLVNVHGFTLIELLMVMAMMGVLAGAFLANFPRMLLRSRDAARRNDLGQYATALESYANENDGFYPEQTGSLVEAATTLCADLGMSDCPDDLRDDQTDCLGELCRYYYQSDGDAGPGPAVYDKGTRYTLRARVEEETGLPSACLGEVFYVLCSGGESGYFCDDPSSTAFILGNCPL